MLVGRCLTKKRGGGGWDGVGWVLRAGSFFYTNGKLVCVCVFGSLSQWNVCCTLAVSISGARFVSVAVPYSTFTQHSMFMVLKLGEGAGGGRPLFIHIQLVDSQPSNDRSVHY